MARFLHPFHSFTFRKYARRILAFSWLSGLGAGAVIFRCTAEPLVSLMPLAPGSQLSIVGLMAVSLLPFLFSAFAVFISCPGLLIPVCFFKACSYVYVSCGVYAAFGNAGWLIHWLLMFTDSASLWVLYLYWMRHISGYRGFRFCNAVGYAALLCLSAATDWCVITPLLRELSF